MCQITVADWVYPVGSLLFLTFDPSFKIQNHRDRSTHTKHKHTHTQNLLSKLQWRLCRVQNCDQMFHLEEVCVKARLCVSGFPPCCHRDVIQLDSAKVPHRTVCMSCECASIGLCSGLLLFCFFVCFFFLFFFTCTGSLLQHTQHKRI